MNKSKFNNGEIVEILRSIKITLYLILVVLVANVVVFSVNMNAFSSDGNNDNNGK